MVIILYHRARLCATKIYKNKTIKATQFVDKIKMLCYTMTIKYILGGNKMSDISVLKKDIENGRYDSTFERLYGKGENIINKQKERYISALDEFAKIYPEYTDVNIFSASGRTEVCGNHTDHNHGKTLSAGINLDEWEFI